MFILAARADDAISGAVIAGISASALAVVILSLIHAVCLWLACPCVGVRGVGYGQALGTALLCGVVIYGFGTVMALSMWVGMRDEAPNSVRLGYSYLLSPINYVYLFAASVLGHAAVFSQRLSDRDGTPVGFGRAAAVAVVYLGLCCVTSTALGLTVLLVRATVRA